MKKIGVLNRDISEVIASMGHGDMLVVSDAGLAIPSTARRIDVAIKPGLPSLIETAKVINQELKVEQIIVPIMMETACPNILKELRDLFGDVKLDKLSIEQYKQLAWASKAIIRTGECTRYANVILVSGVIF